MIFDILVMPANVGTTVKPVLNDLSKKKKKYVFKTDNRLMQVKSIVECFLQFI